MAGPWNLQGPAVDFSPLGQLYAGFIGAQDHARKQRQDEEAGPILEKLMAAYGGQAAQPGSLAALAAQTQGAGGAAPRLPSFAQTGGKMASAAPIGGFNESVNRVLQFEGGFNPNDAGKGPTNYGISSAANPGVDVRNLTPDGAKAIYKQKYWDAIGGDALASKNPALAHVAFDAAVNSGPGKAAEWLQASGGDPNKFLALRSEFLGGLLQRDPQKYGPFARAWSQRIASLQADINGGQVAPPQGAAPRQPGMMAFAGAPGGMTLPAAAAGPGPAQAPIQVAQANLPTQNPNGGDPTKGFNTPIGQNVYDSNGFNAPLNTAVPLGRPGAPAAPASPGTAVAQAPTVPPAPVPRGGYMAKDGAGNPIAVDADGNSILQSAPATMQAQARTPNPRADTFGSGDPGQSGGQASFYMPGSATPPVDASRAPAAPAGLPANAVPAVTAGGISPEFRNVLGAALRNPSTRAAALQMWQQAIEPKSQFDFQTVGDQLYRVNKRTGAAEPVAGINQKPMIVPQGSAAVDSNGRIIFQSDPKSEDTPDQKNFKFAQQDGFKGTFNDFLQSGKKLSMDQQMADREAAARRVGLTPDDPRYKPFMLTGDVPKENQQALTASDKKAIQEADEAVMTNEGVIKNLQDAKSLSKNAFDGWGAGIRGTIGSQFGNEHAKNTVEMQNLVTTNALTSLKSIFGGNPTEGERAILLQIQGSASQPDEIRQRIFDRAIDLANKRLEFNRQRAKELRGGEYYKPNRGQDGQQPDKDGWVTAPNGVRIRRLD